MFNVAIPLLISGTLTDSPVLLLSFSSVSPGSTVITFCQGIEDPAGGHACMGAASSTQAAGTIDSSGRVVTDPTDLTFSLETTLGVVGFNFIDFSLDGILDATADNGAGDPQGALTDGTYTARLAAADLCAMPVIDNPTTAAALNCPNPLSFADLIDGPEVNCGQDGSFGAEAKCLGAIDVDHHAGIDGAGMFYELSGTVDLEGTVIE